MDTMSSLFEDAPIIHAYTVEQAVADGLFTETPTSLRREAGYRVPVVFSRDAWDYAVTWDDDDDRLQDETGRLWDVLWMCKRAAMRAAHDPGERFAFRVYAVPRLTKSGNRSRAESPVRHRLEVVAQAYNTTGALCLTILLPGEN